jgi:hypothetical protein
MKCTWNNCGKETGVPCPPQWKKHEKFSPIALRIFFSGTQYENELKELSAFVCEEHMPEYKAYVQRSERATMAAKKRSKKDDYSI